MQDSTSIPHGWQLVYLALTGILSSAGTLLVDRINKRRREPVELRKIEAETKSIHITAENSQASIGLETLREIQNVITKAEQRREEWLQKEEQLRGQRDHWQQKSMALEDELGDSRQANAQLNIQLRLSEHQIKRMKSLLDYHSISYSELDRPKPPSD